MLWRCGLINFTGFYQIVFAKFVARVETPCMSSLRIPIQMDKFKNKYRIASARLQNWDYGSPRLYFITICTKDREQYFGKIENGEIFLNELALTDLLSLQLMNMAGVNLLIINIQLCIGSKVLLKSQKSLVKEIVQFHFMLVDLIKLMLCTLTQCTCLLLNNIKEWCRFFPQWLYLTT